MKMIKELTILVIAVLVIGIFTSGTLLKEPRRIVIAPVSLQAAQAQVQQFIKNGYNVESITPESVSTSINGRPGGITVYPGKYRDIRGGFLIVLIKYE